MTPPPGRSVLGLGDTDQPSRTKPRYGVRLSTVWLLATLLGLFSTALAWQLTRSLGKPAPPLGFLLFLNATYWFVWALFTPAIIWLSQHFRFERQGLWRALAVHLPSVVLFSFGHIAVMSAVRWWLATASGRPFNWWETAQSSALETIDWEMMTYWAIAGLSHAVLYYRESRDREMRGSRLETQLVEAQLTALQKQLHPHFLFNTLNAISALMHRDVEAADRTLVRLSDLLRLALENTGIQETTLQRELEFLSKYLEIEQTRFADRLSVTFDVQPEVLDALVPNLILQPLVENAIKHGVSKKSGPGHIAITARREGGKLWMQVQDDGVGLSADAWTALQKGIGVSTSHARLRHLFGADFRFEFRRQQPGLAVIVSFPYHTAPAAAAETTRVEHHRRIGPMDATPLRPHP